MNKRHQRSTRMDHPRKLQGKSMRESIMIYCEGETEVGYFSSFKKRAKCVGMGTALSTVREAISHKNHPTNKLYDQYWVVFDKDDSHANEFDQAIALALANDIKVAWSNQCFELWFILHFRHLTHKYPRKQYADLLKEHLPLYNVKDKGEEQGKSLFQQTIALIQIAKANAFAGYNSFSQYIPASLRESSTTIYTLIEKIDENS